MEITTIICITTLLAIIIYLCVKNQRLKSNMRYTEMISDVRLNSLKNVASRLHQELKEKGYTQDEIRETIDGLLDEVKPYDKDGTSTTNRKKGIVKQ